MDPRTGVLVENVVFKFNKKQSPVLDNINITVPRGAIYCLLGPSGCGKTTMIKLILGLLKPQSGQVTVSCGGAVPGPSLGWMPQSLALHTYFSVVEILRYYATLGGLPPHLRSQRIRTVLEFLNLSDKADTQLTQISGGQQRRLSLGCAIVHSPLLLVLDEPTVGTDPLLRLDIWRALRSVAEQGTTVLLTTHYIEEAASADIVAFLRLGRLLAEGKPQQLLQRFSCKSLERLFFQLCYEDEKKYQEEIEEGQTLLENQIAEDERKPSGAVEVENCPVKKKPEKDVSELSDSTIAESRSINVYIKTEALLFKNLIVLCRHRLFMCFNIFLPVLNFLIFYAAIGRPPADLTLSFCVSSLTSSPACDAVARPSCSSSLPSIHSVAWLCQLKQRTEGEVLFKFCPDESCVRDDILSGRAQLGFSLPDKISFELATTSWDSDNNITVWKDPTNKIKFEATLLALSSAGRQIADEVLQSCDGGGGALELLSVSAALGSLEPESQVTMLPGMVPITLFFMALSLTADLLVTELEAGTLARDWSQGVNTSHNLTAQVMVQLIIVSLQVTSSVIMMALLYPLSPSIILAVFSLLLLISLCGMICGVIISLICKARDQTIQAALALIFPLFLLSGVLWPSQAMPVWLQYISHCLPLTPPSHLISSLILRSTATTGLVLRSIMLPVLWIAGLAILTKIFILDTLHRR